MLLVYTRAVLKVLKGAVILRVFFMDLNFSLIFQNILFLLVYSFLQSGNWDLYAA